jgi:hypothetical protein
MPLPPRLSRRHLGLAAGLVVWPWLAGLGAAAAFAPPDGGVLDLAIVRKGDVIGDYRSDFATRPDGSLEVITRIDAEITLGPVRLYHFRHSSTETWRDGKLVALFSDTDDDGDIHHLQAHQANGALAINVDGKTETASAEAVPSSLWTLAMLDADRPIFDIVDGQQFKAERHCEAAKPPEGPGTACKITGELERTLHYSPKGLLDSLSFSADDGSTVTYRGH